jgi:hypothetical protein
MVAVQGAVGGRGRGRRYATAQVNNAYTVLLSSQFQKFCRDLHSQAADHLANQVPASIRTVVLARFTDGRKLDAGNPNPGNLGSDFKRFGLELWPNVLGPQNAWRKKRLEELNAWRNAISHHDFAFDHPELAAFAGRTGVRLGEVARWRRACDGLAADFDRVVSRYLANLTGTNPW